MVASIHISNGFLWLHLSPITLLKLNKFRIAIQQNALDMRKNMHILGYRDYAYFVNMHIPHRRDYAYFENMHIHESTDYAYFKKCISQKWHDYDYEYPK